MIKVDPKKEERILQGDIFRDIEYIESIMEDNGRLNISKILFPYIIVLSQDCDLAQDYRFRTEEKNSQDKYLISVLVAPIYNYEHVCEGSHLSELEIKSQEINKKKTPGKNLRRNLNPRYHYLEFPSDVGLVPSVIDFKHYFSVSVMYLNQEKNEKFVCSVKELYREDISHRFAAFLSRIGLP